MKGGKGGNRANRCSGSRSGAEFDRRRGRSAARACVLALAAAPLPETAGTVRAAGKPVIIVYYGAGMVNASLVQKIYDEFERSHPDIRVAVNQVPWSDFWVKLQTMVAGGTLPDMVDMGGEQPPYYADAGVFMDPGLLVRGDHIDLHVYYPESVETFTRHGKLHGIPVDIAPAVLLYNKDLFDAAQVPYPDDQWIWDGLLPAAQNLTGDTNGDGRTHQFGFTIDLWWTGWSSLAYVSGGQFLDATHTYCLLDRPAVYEATQWHADTSNKHRAAPATALHSRPYSWLRATPILVRAGPAWPSVDFGIWPGCVRCPFIGMWLLVPKEREGPTCWPEPPIASRLKRSVPKSPGNLSSTWSPPPAPCDTKMGLGIPALRGLGKVHRGAGQAPRQLEGVSQDDPLSGGSALESLLQRN